MRSLMLDLEKVRGAFSSEFLTLDKCVELKDTEGAKLARSAIQKGARTALGLSDADFPGYYVFIDPRADAMEQIIYIGIAKSANRTIARRLEDRLKDDNCLDTQLDGVEMSEFNMIASNRLITALPQSGANYVTDHYNTACLFKASKSIVITESMALPARIKNVEKALIGSASAAGANLFNCQQLRFRGPIVDEVYGAGRTVIENCRQFGLSDKASNLWIESLSRFAANELVNNSA